MLWGRSVVGFFALLFTWSRKSVTCLRAMQRVAIVGGGYAGLGTAARLSKVAKSIHVYDNFPPGFADASAASAGIMHPMATRGKVIWKGLEGMQQSLDLMRSVQTASSGCIYDDKVRLNRLLFTKTDLDMWTNAATKNSDELELVEVSSVLSGSSEALGAVRIKRAVVVDSPAYLKALWAKTQLNCPQAEWKQQKVQSVAELSQRYDAVVLACGGGITNLCAPLGLPAGNKIGKIRLVRGQNAVYEGTGEDDLDSGYLSGEYCIPYTHSRGSTEDNKVFMLGGSTHEHITSHQYETLTVGDKSPNLSILQGQIQNRLNRIYPALAHYTPIHTVAGTKVVTNRDELGRLPIVGKLHIGCANSDATSTSDSSDKTGGSSGGTIAGKIDNVWVHTGFGSRGLILHALTSQYLCNAMMNNDESLIPDYLHFCCKIY